MLADSGEIVKQLDDILRRASKAREGGGRTSYMEAVGLYCSAITRLSSPSSSYVALMKEICNRPLNGPAEGFAEAARASQLQGIVRALRADFAGGWTQNFQELVHADLFSDFLEMAESLVGNGYKDAAAVIAGGVLEQHLRELCAKHGVSISAKPKLDTMNADLAKNSAYGKNEQKQVTAWAGIRNDAAHGNYAGYKKDDVQRLIAGTRDFVSRFPA